MHRLVCILLFCIALPAAGYAADLKDDLYRTQAVVTGKGETNRQLGFRDCLDKVIVRVSGDQRLLAKPGLGPLRAAAGDLIASFTYADRLAGVPIHDEQGSYDRPHDLTCIFDPTKLDAVLAGLGGKPWLAPRPTVVPLVAVERAGRRFVLTSDGADGPSMDVSFAAAAGLVAIGLELPRTTAVARASLDAQTLWVADEATRGRLAEEAGGDVPLLGRLTWSDPDLGWVAEWRIAFEGKTYDWQIRGVSFDEAFRVAMRGAAQVLSGNGQP
ncbi:MAG TPA: DUF2066 domain-containing protein [Rhizobiaceae bacterium]